jgi:hypothetical protein
MAKRAGALLVPLLSVYDISVQGYTVAMMGGRIRVINRITIIAIRCDCNGCEMLIEAGKVWLIEYT